MVLIISKKLLLRFVIIVALVIILIFSNFAINALDTNVNSDTGGYIALIIDDFGNGAEGTDDMLRLGIPITAAVMPFLPYSSKDANDAHNAGLEVILHIPMEAVHGKKEWLGPRGITIDLSSDEVEKRIIDGLDEVKWAIGMNNHMGSKITQDKRIMESVLKIAKEKNLIFIDSGTTQNSVVGEVADAMNVIHFKRDVFLDNSKIQKNIEESLRKLGDVAIKKGYAIGIGHVGPEGGRVTAEAIKAVYPKLEEKGIKFIYVSQLRDIFGLHRK